MTRLFKPLLLLPVFFVVLALSLVGLPIQPHNSPLGDAIGFTQSTAYAQQATVCTTKANPTLTVAVASNLWVPGQQLATDYETANPGAVVQICHNSTGLLIAEIQANANLYDLFLAANYDQATNSPTSLCAIDNSAFCDSTVDVYIRGIPVLWSAVQNIDLNEGNDLVDNQAIETLVYANPVNAPYGAAAVEILGEQKLELENAGKLATPLANIELTYQSVANGTNTVGIIAKSQICVAGVASPTYYEYPDDIFNSVLQAGVVIKNTNGHKTIAENFFDYVKGSGKNTLINSFCYAEPPISAK